jgi:hypothetical protein
LIVGECFAVTLRFLTSANLPEVKMKERELSLTTSRVADIKVVSGQATANEINRYLRTGKERSFGHIASLTILRSLIVAGFIVALAPMPARADEDERGGNKKIEALEAKLASLQATVSALQSQINTLQGQLTAVQSNKALGLGPFVSVVSSLVDGVNGPHIYFTGANIHIVSGSGRTDDNGNPSGLGNLIIGYDEDPNIPLTGDSSDGLLIMQAPGFPTPLVAGDRGGSHNLVIGGGNRFTRAAFGGLVAGERNTIKGFGASVSGGFNNTASDLFASVSGGVRNFASAQFDSVSGGGFNTAGPSSGASVSGGFENIASGPFASVIGGIQNTAGGIGTVVIGGQGVIDNNNNSIAPNPPFP